MPRMFIAIDLSDVVKESMLLLQNGLRGAKWIARENLHLTIRFIGEVSELEVDDIHSALCKVRSVPFVLKLGGAGVFSTGSRPRSVWIGVKNESPIVSLKSDIDSALARVGFGTDARKYVPHVTVAKLKGRCSNLIDFMARVDYMPASSIEIGQFVLFSSYLSRKGPKYTPEIYYPLND